MMKIEVKDIQDYIDQMPELARPLLVQMRNIIKKAAPNSIETFSYQMPAYRFHGPLVYFGAHKNHIGFYPGSYGLEKFKNEISNFKSSKGAVQFPLDQPLPVELISSIVKFRVEENLQKLQVPKNLKTCKNGHNYYKSSDFPKCPECDQNVK